MSEVRINITNLHFAEVTESGEGTLTFKKPERIVGAEEVTRKPEISSGRLYGDGVIRFKTSKKSAYSLSIGINNLPPKWRAYLEGTKVSESGVESAASTDVPKPFAVGWEVEKTGGKSEFIWFPFCLADPIEQTTQQSEDNVNYSRDKINVIAMEHTSLKRFYTFVDQEIQGNATITAEKFFSKVQTTDTITQ